VSAPGQQLVGDIAYLPTWEGWLRLAVVIDCHTKMLFVQGPGRVGRTALPGAFADRAAASGRVRDALGVVLEPGAPTGRAKLLLRFGVDLPCSPESVALLLFLASNAPAAGSRRVAGPRLRCSTP
jgi:hypothetical protein